MTRINTNVSSLNAQKSLARSNVSLQEALTRLSTGLRINSGKDNPAGLIASEVLRADIVSTQRGITNSQRANQMIATADSALGQVSSLLNDIRGLISDAANTGALSEEQISANQLQIDSSLEAIDRIAQVTQFQGKRLLDGNLDFVTQDVDATKINDLRIDTANFGTQTEINVGVEVVAQAKQASLKFDGTQINSGVVLELGGASGFETFNFGAGSSITEMKDAVNLVSDVLGIQASFADRTAETATQAVATLLNRTSTDGIKFTADAAGSSAGNFTVRYKLGAAQTFEWTAGDPNVLDVVLKQTTAATTAATVNPGTDVLSVAATTAGSAFDATHLVIDTVSGTAGGYYDYETKKIHLSLATEDAAGFNAAKDTLADIFTIGDATDDDVAVVGEYALDFSLGAHGADGGQVAVDNDNKIDAIITNLTNNFSAGATDLGLTATRIGTGGADIYAEIVNSSGTIGSINSTGDGTATDDPNNMIQLTGGDGVTNLGVNFVANGANQALSIDYAINSRTGGYSTALLTSNVDDKATYIKVAYTAAQGQEHDGITVNFVDTSGGSGGQSVKWDKENDTLNVYFDKTTATANSIEALINTSNLFTATAYGTALSKAAAGSFAGTETAETEDGRIYDSITVNLATDANGNAKTTAAEAILAVNSNSVLNSLGIRAANVFSSTGAGIMETGALTLGQLGVTSADATASGTTTAANGAKAALVVTAKTAGAAYENVKVVFENDSAVTQAGEEFATYDSSNRVLTFHIKDGTSTANDVVNNWANNSGSVDAAALFTVAAAGDGTGKVTADDIGWLRDGITYSGTTIGAAAAQGGFDAGDVVGTGGLEFESIGYGTKAFVSVKALSGTFTVIDADGNTKDRDYGADADVRVNGITAVTDGLKASLNTSVLDLSFSILSTVADGSTSSFKITSGGAQFQLGPDVVSNQQARLGIQSVNSAKLGGDSGRLYQLKSGGEFSLKNNVKMAAAVAEDAITAVVTMRGRLGAFQRTTLDTNISSLTDTLEALTEAESSIRDADFAEESAKLTRAQILVQSGLSVLSTANSNPQNVLSLLR